MKTEVGNDSTPRGTCRYKLWEWCSGSATLSAAAAKKGLAVGPPIDFRTGWNLKRDRDQRILVNAILEQGVGTLILEPSCRNWGANSKGKPEPQKTWDRRSDFGVLTFMVVASVLTLCLGGDVIIENPRASDIFEGSPLALLKDLSLIHI